jgi:hypothetical protein
MRRRVLLALSVAGLLGTSVLAADEGEKSCCKKKQACASKTAKAGKLRCSLTGIVVEGCCCVQREGKLYCTLAKKGVDSCCCESASRVSGTSGASTVEASGSSLR